MIEKTPSENLSLLILASGQSKRLGRPKQLLDWNGETLLNNTLRKVESLGYPCHLVLGAYYQQILETLPEGSRAKIHYNSYWEKGVLSTLKKGLEFIPDDHNVLVTLCDLPGLQKEDYRKIIAEGRNRKLSSIATHYPSGAGVPALLSRKLIHDILACDENCSPKRFLRQDTSTFLLDFNQEKLRDVDTWEDYISLRRNYGFNQSQWKGSSSGSRPRYASSMGSER